MDTKNVQVLLYTSYLHIIGGIETFVLNYVELIGQHYSIGVLCPKLPGRMQNMIRKKCKLFTEKEPISCDTLIMIRMMDLKPEYVTAKKSIRMCHACKSEPDWYIRGDCDEIVNVSEASLKSFGNAGRVIYNPLIKSEKKALIFVSATRIPALDKGKNADRMLKLADMLNNKGIPFLWFNFSDIPLNDAPKGFVNIGVFHDLQPLIARADYLVQLSDHEGFGYSVLEALLNKTAVICTPFETTKELGVIDGVNGYIIPFDLQFDVTKLLKVPEFDFEYDNESIVKKWKSLLGKAKPFTKYVAPADTDICTVKALRDYQDIVLKRVIRKGTEFNVTSLRAQDLVEKNLCRIID